MKKTLSRADITRLVHCRVGKTQQAIAQIVNEVFEQISDELVSSGQVKLNSFAHFHVRQKSARIGRNPKTGEEVMIAPRRSISFSPSAAMQKRIAAMPVRE